MSWGMLGSMATTPPPAPSPALAPRAEAPEVTGALTGALSACCGPLAREPLSVEDAERLATVLKAIAVPTRLRLLSMIYARDGGEACVCELTEPLGLTQPTVSHHLKVLVDAGLITREKRGVWAYYRPVPGTMATLAAMLTPAPAPVAFATAP
ncbi:transcriptional regulator, ArsR family [Parafrankia sp. EUN1f]|nr:transcriptional regulator, ArsR family [Parafrankia sp. EUN1f]